METPQATRIHATAWAAGKAAADRSMRAAGRRRWNDDDWDAAIAEMDRILGNTVEPPQPSAKERRSA